MSGPTVLPTPNSLTLRPKGRTGTSRNMWRSMRSPGLGRALDTANALERRPLASEASGLARSSSQPLSKGVQDKRLNVFPLEKSYVKSFEYGSW